MTTEVGGPSLFMMADIGASSLFMTTEVGSPLLFMMATIQIPTPPPPPMVVNYKAPLMLESKQAEGP